MARKKDRSPEELARRDKIRELLQLANVGSMDDIHELFKETIGEFMENGLEAELDEELGYGRGLSQILCKQQRSSAKCQSVKSERAAEPSDVRLITS